MQQTFSVTGMTCGHCEKAVTRAVKALDAQAEVRIDRPNNQVVIESAQSRDALAQAITDEGYTVGV